MTLHHSCFTNQILYVDLIFELPELKNEELSLLSLFAKLLPEVGCGGSDYAENLALSATLYWRVLMPHLALHVTQENPDVCGPAFSLRGKALYRNAQKLFSLFSDSVTSLDLTDRRSHSRVALSTCDRIARSAVNKCLDELRDPNIVERSFCSLFRLRSMAWNSLLQIGPKWAKKFDKTPSSTSLQRIAQSCSWDVQKPHLVLSCDQEEFVRLEKAELFPLKTTQ